MRQVVVDTKVGLTLRKRFTNTRAKVSGRVRNLERMTPEGSNCSIVVGYNGGLVVYVSY